MPINRPPGLVTSEQLLSPDLNMGWEACLDKAGIVPSVLVGQRSMQSAYQPLTFSIDGANNVTIGGTNQRCLLGGRLCDEIGPQAFPVPANAGGSPRVDTIYGAPANVGTNAQPRDVKKADGSVQPNVPVPQRAQGIAWAYVPQGGSTPALPPGTTGPWVAVLQITAPAGSTIGGVTAADLLFLLDTPAQAITSVLPLPFIDLDAYPGRDRTGAIDNSAILTQAYADAASSGINMVWFSGKLLISAPVAPVADVALWGSGLASATIMQGTAANDIFASTGVNNLEFSGFTMNAHASPTAGSPFNLTSTVGLVLQDVTWSGFYLPALFTTSQNFAWRNVQGTLGVSGGVKFLGFILGNFFDCDFSNNGGHGVYCTGSNNSGAGWIMKWYGGRAVQNNQNALGASGFFIDTNITGVEWFGFGFGNNASANPAVNPQLYGLALAGGNDYLRAFGCGFIGNVTAPIQGSLGAHCAFVDCPGYNPVSSQGGFSQPSIPSTGAPVQNLFGADAMVLVNVGSATFTNPGITTTDGLSYSATTCASGAQVLVPVKKGESITLNYTGSPTWKWSVA